MSASHHDHEDVATSSPSPHSKEIASVPRSLLRHIVDVHCHPTDSPISTSAIENLPIRICAMATRKSDQALVAELADAHPDRVTPCFGYHPWFTHFISLQPLPETPEAKEAHYRSLFLSKGEPKASHLEAFSHILPDLPHPFSLSSIISDLRSNFTRFLAAREGNPSRPKPMLGEVGLDRSFRIPFIAYDPSLREPPESASSDPSRPRLTPFNVPMQHQLDILEAQIGLAVELGLNVSVHSVKAQEPTIQLLERMRVAHEERWDAISVDMHSCGLSVETWKMIEKRHPNVYMSLSTGINVRSPEHRNLIAECSPTKILVESDVPELEQCAERTWAMLHIVAEVKGWGIEEADWTAIDESADDEPGGHGEGWGAVRRLERNWSMFEKGDHKRPEAKKSAKHRRRVKEFRSASDDGE